jgi:hypothetical protein
MKTMKYITTIILNLVYLTTMATTYYVDASSGLDSNNGTSTSKAWKTIAKVNSAALKAGDFVLFARGQTYRGNLIPKSGTASANISYGAYGSGNKPLFLGSISRKLTTDWVSAGTNLWKTSNVVTIGGAAVDAGNLIFNNEASVGWKVSSPSQVTVQGRFYSDVAAKTVTMYSVGNPGSVYSEIEIALCQNIINQSDKSYIVYENLDLRYTGAHAIGGSTTHHIIIKDIDISYIGGSYLSGFGTGTTRYGNGVEFYNDAHDNIVERCTIIQIYDTGITNQGDLANCQQFNLYYRNIIIRNTEWSFEMWLRGTGASLHDIYFENNTCLGAGIGWGHEQRVDPNAAHVCFWGTSASFSNIFIRNNIFSNSVGAGIFEGKTSLADLETSKVTINNNDWDVTNMLAVMTGWNSGKPGPINTYYSWSYYRSMTKQDANSITSNPLLTPEYSIPSNSPCVNTGVVSTATTDFIGTSRPQGSGWDIGAYEFNPTSSSSETNFDKSFSIYPNPATDSIKINPVGELMKEFEITQSAQIDISELVKGVYLVQLKGFPEQTQKFIKQ